MTTAPAASPNRGAVFRSLGEIILEISSTPITRTFLGATAIRLRATSTAWLAVNWLPWREEGLGPWQLVTE